MKIFNEKWNNLKDKLAVIDADNNISLTYSELYNNIKISKSHKLIFLFADNSLDTLLHYLSALYSNNPIALFDKNLSDDKKLELCEIYQPDIICGSNIRFEKTKQYILNKDLSLLLSTSGSTGSSKLVRLSNKNIISNAKSIVEALCMTKDDANITSLPFHYSYGLSVINSTLLSGGTLVLTNQPILSQKFWNVFRDNNCTSFAGVPYSYNILKKLDIRKLNIPSLKILTQAGGKLDELNIEYFYNYCKDINCKFYVMYGQTEATARITILPYDELYDKIGYAGKAIPNGKIEIENDEVVYYGDNVMMGYAESYKDLQKEDELNGKLYTGDLGFLDGDFLKITGRSKRICKILGYRLNLDEIQNFINKYIESAVIEKDSIIYIFCQDNSVRNLVGNNFNINTNYIKIINKPILYNQNKKIDYKALELLC